MAQRAQPFGRWFPLLPWQWRKIGQWHEACGAQKTCAPQAFAFLQAFADALQRRFLLRIPGSIVPGETIDGDGQANRIGATHTIEHIFLAALETWPAPATPFASTGGNAQWRENVRLRAIDKARRRQNRTATEVASQVGYGSLSHFIQSLKALTSTAFPSPPIPGFPRPAAARAPWPARAKRWRPSAPRPQGGCPGYPLSADRCP